MYKAAANDLNAFKKKQPNKFFIIHWKRIMLNIYFTETSKNEFYELLQTDKINRIEHFHTHNGCFIKIIKENSMITILYEAYNPTKFYIVD
jgi:hypothetical protein